jgi:hypothetical protein
VAHDFTEVTLIAIEKKPKATKCSNHCTISLIAHTAKIVVRILRRSIERKTKDFLGEDQFGFGRRRGTRNAIGILRIIPDKLWKQKRSCVHASQTGRRHITA